MTEFSPNKGRQIVLVEDDITLNRLLTEQLDRAGYKVASAHSRAQLEEILQSVEPTLILLDIKLPDCNGVELIPALSELCPIVVMTAFGTISEAVKAVKAGAFEYFMKPVSWDQLEVTLSRVFETTAMKRSLRLLKERNRRESQSMIGESAAFRQVRELVEVVADSGTTVLIQGESGVGKELVARAIHQASDRATANYVAVDCCTLQENLFESELFGHERGAFTGADRRKEGLIEAAEGGTVFLDEIGEIGPGVQAKMLRVLETGRFRRLGGLKDLRANVRFVAATNADLKTMSETGRFRADLYYRLAAFVIHVPPLRERKEDIASIAQALLLSRQFMRKIDKRFSKAALNVLRAYDWPGNVRELRNVVERAALMSGDSTMIHVHHLPILQSSGADVGEVVFKYDHEPTLDEIRDDYLHRLLGKYDGNRGKVASVMGIGERSIYRLLQHADRGPADASGSARQP